MIMKRTICTLLTVAAMTAAQAQQKELVILHLSLIHI